MGFLPDLNYDELWSRETGPWQVPITFGEFNVSDVRPAQLFNVVADIEGQLKWDNSMSEAPSAPLDAWMGDFGVSFQRVALLGRSTDWWMFSANFLLVETKNRQMAHLQKFTLISDVDFHRIFLGNSLF